MIRSISRASEREPRELRSELADRGSVFAMRAIGAQFELGYGVESDLAQAEKYYDQALRAGSWMATLDLAHLLFRHGINDKWVGILEGGVEADFVPAGFWLAWYRHKRNPRGQHVLDVRSLMEKAAIAGHPGARLKLALWKTLGKYGVLKIREGFREFRSVTSDFQAGKLLDHT